MSKTEMEKTMGWFKRWRLRRKIRRMHRLGYGSSEIRQETGASDAFIVYACLSGWSSSDSGGSWGGDGGGGSDGGSSGGGD